MSSSSSNSNSNNNADDNNDSDIPQQRQYGRVSNDEFILTPEQVQAFHRDGCVTIPNVLREDEVQALADVADRFFSGEIKIPGKDYCDISKPFGIPVDDWSLINCMLPTRYYPPLAVDNVNEKLASSMAQQLFPHSHMVQDYDQFLNKRPGKKDAVFAWHQDMAYWPGTKALGLGENITDTCTFSLALDDSDVSNGCLRYAVGSGVNKTLRPHLPLCGNSRDEGHAVTVHVDEAVEEIRHAPAKRGSVTIHDEYVVHGSSGNTCRDRQRRTYVIAHRAKAIVDAERKIGFTHSHNDDVNWDTFKDGESHRVKLLQHQEHEQEHGE
jgi:phytanoyl-CoA hydroxylase